MKSFLNHEVFYKMILVNLIGILVLCSCVLNGCGKESDKMQDKFAELEGVEEISEPLLNAPQTTTVIKGDILDRDIYPGILTPYVEELSFPAEGYFGSYNVSLGQQVSKGEVLATTNLENAETKLEALETSLETLENNYTYHMTLYNNQLETLKLQLEECYMKIDLLEYLTPAYTAACVEAGLLDGDIKRTELKIKQFQEEYDFEKNYLEIQIDILKKEMKGNVIKAPFDGVVVQLGTMLKGDWIEKGNPCVAIADTSKCCVVADYIQKIIAEKALGFEIFIDGQTYKAVYQPLNTEAYKDLIQKNETAYSTYLIEEDLTDLYEYGHSALAIVNKNEAKDVLILSNLAIIRDGSQYYCYVDKQGTKEKVILTIGLKDAIHTEIISGLEEGDVVYIE